MGEEGEEEGRGRRTIALESSLMKSVLEIQRNRCTQLKKGGKDEDAAPPKGKETEQQQQQQQQQQHGGKEQAAEQAREREKARAAKLRMEEAALAKKKEKGKKKGGGRKAARGRESKEEKMLSQQERERQEARQRKMAWVERQGGDARKVTAAEDAAARITPAGPLEKITVSIGPDAVEMAGEGEAARAGKDAASWAELGRAEKKAAAALGWTAASWNAGEACDASYRRWQQLNAEQRKAAVQLGYDPASWNADAGLDADTAGGTGAKSNGQGAGQKAPSTAARGHERMVTRRGSRRGTGSTKAGGAATESSVDEEELEARLESEGKLVPRYVRGRSSLLLLQVETGPGTRASMVVKQGDDPYWLAETFSRRHDLPAQLQPVVQQNIIANLAELKNQRTQTKD